MTLLLGFKIVLHYMIDHMLWYIKPICIIIHFRMQEQELFHDSHQLLIVERNYVKNITALHDLLQVRHIASTFIVNLLKTIENIFNT